MLLIRNSGSTNEELVKLQRQGKELGPIVTFLEQEVCEATGMKKLNTTAYYPQPDGLSGEFQ